jgi:hypothetical protein
MRISFLISIVFFLLAVVAAGAALRELWSEAHLHQAERFLAEWQIQKLRPNEKSWRLADDSVKSAIELDIVANAKHLERQGQISEWRPSHLGNAGSAQRTALIAYYSAATTRPNWPYIWLRVAHAKASLGEFDSEFDKALGQSRDMSGDQLEANYAITSLGIKHWNDISYSGRRVIIESINAVSMTDTIRRMQLWARIKKMGLVLVVCQSIPEDTARNFDACWHLVHHG